MSFFRYHRKNAEISIGNVSISPQLRLKLSNVQSAFHPRLHMQHRSFFVRKILRVDINHGLKSLPLLNYLDTDETWCTYTSHDTQIHMDRVDRNRRFFVNSLLIPIYETNFKPLLILACSCCLIKLPYVVKWNLFDSTIKASFLFSFGNVSTPSPLTALAAYVSCQLSITSFPIDDLFP